MSLRKIISRFLLPNLEKELSQSINHEINAMNAMNTHMGPEIYSFQAKSAGGSTGAFSASTAVRSPARLEKVTRVVESRGLFHE
mmetsp:Transcript_29484/g.33917  ORF Transcript_29484/g.33917 Transcript_29484/m.33917 type:complete len:84 (-) Transcript_29484:445-696(-)